MTFKFDHFQNLYGSGLFTENVQFSRLSDYQSDNICLLRKHNVYKNMLIIRKRL